MYTVSNLSLLAMQFSSTEREVYLFSKNRSHLNNSNELVTRTLGVDKPLTKCDRYYFLSAKYPSSKRTHTLLLKLGTYSSLLSLSKNVIYQVVFGEILLSFHKCHSLSLIISQNNTVKSNEYNLLDFIFILINLIRLERNFKNV